MEEVPCSQREWVDVHLINAAYDIDQDDLAYGYRFISDELCDAGIKASERRVWRLCSQQIWSVFAKKQGQRLKAGPPVHDDLVERRFTTTRANELWLTDITKHPTAWIPVVVATGCDYLVSSRAYRRSAGLSQFSDFRGRSLSSCATC